MWWRRRRRRRCGCGCSRSVVWTVLKVLILDIMARHSSTLTWRSFPVPQAHNGAAVVNVDCVCKVLCGVAVVVDVEVVLLKRMLQLWMCGRVVPDPIVTSNAELEDNNRRKELLHLVVELLEVLHTTLLKQRHKQQTTNQTINEQQTTNRSPTGATADNLTKGTNYKYKKIASERAKQASQLTR